MRKFIDEKNLKSNNNYTNYLKAICSLSRLFSESNIPYLHYRIAENIFCKAFNAENLSRDDLAYDARIGEIGIGLKTFIDKGTNQEKITELNMFSNQLRKLSGKKLAVTLSELRNQRIEFANRTYGIKSAVYHCVARKKHQLNIFESDYDLIDIANIKKIKTQGAGISFEDGKNEYSFNFSKTTLFKKFYTPQNATLISIEILDDPLQLILHLFNQQIKRFIKEKIAGVNFVILPLYSLRESKMGHKIVPEKSGLNQWNAGGRPRDKSEVYIPIPKIIHNKYPQFFPRRETSFNLYVPTGEKLSAKLCQENSKALMTNPNNALADWLLRRLLKLKEGELLTYDRLKLLGIDSVRITKIDKQNYKINFTKIDSYENFIEERNE
jgi:hypothetical protein